MKIKLELIDNILFYCCMVASTGGIIGMAGMIIMAPLFAGILVVCVLIVGVLVEVHEAVLYRLRNGHEMLDAPHPASWLPALMRRAFKKL